MAPEECFDGSPFVLTADPQIGACWAGRQDILARVLKMVRGLETRPDSTLDLLWANFGSGKSHALFHIAHLLHKANTKTIVLFVEIPEQLKTFLDLYRRILAEIPWQRVAPLIEQTTVPGADPDLVRAARVIAHGDTVERAIAVEWTNAGRPHIKDLRSLMGISSRIEDDVRATEIASNIVRILGAQKLRVVLMFDEFQRLGGLSDKIRSSILSSIRTLFSKNPTGLSMIAATATRVEKTAVDILPPELRTLMGMRPSIALPEMNEAEAYEFVLGRFACFRPEGYQGDVSYPIGDAAIRETIRYIANETNARLIPRTILQALSWIYDETIENKRDLSPADVSRLLRQLSWASASADDKR